MKKILAVALAACLSFGLVFAQEEESKSIGSPSFEAKNTISAKGKTNQLGNFESGELENALEAKFAIGFDVNEKISVTPFVSNETSFKEKDIMVSRGTLPFNSNIFKLGLELGMTPMEMLGISFNLGYLMDFSTDNLDYGNIDANGFFAGVGLDVNVENFFIAAKLGYDVEGKFTKSKYGDKDKALLKGKLFEHTVGAELVFDFFNFIKDGLNSGLVIANEFKMSSGSLRDMDKSSPLQSKSSTMENDFGIGLHFNPVEYFDFTFLTKLGYEAEKEYDTGNKKWNDPKKTSTLGLSLVSAFTHNNFSFEIEYNPTLKSKEVASNGTVTKFEKKEKEHELKIAVGFAF